MNLSKNIDFDLKRFFLWWGRELSFWIPERLKQVLSDKTGYVFLHVTAEKIKFSSLIAGQSKTIVELAFNEQGLTQAQKLLEENEGVKNAHLILRLDSEQAIKKIIYLPAAAKENIKKVISFEIDKYTPFNNDQVYFALKLLGKEENGQIKVLLVVTPREVLDAIYLQLNSAEIYPDIVDYVEEANNFTEDLEIYNLLPEWERPVKNKIVQTLTGLFSFILIVLTVAVLVFPVWHEAQNVDTLRQQIKQLKNETEFVQSRQLEIDQIVDETDQLNKVKENTPVLLEIINTLSHSIKDDTWMTHLQFKQGRLQLQGQSPTAEALIGVLEASPLFSNVRFVSPLTKDKRTGLERFQISINVNPKGDADEG